MKLNLMKICAGAMLAGALFVAGCTEESRALDKIQDGAVKMIKVLDSNRPTKYIEITKVFTQDTLNKFPKEAYEETQRVCGERFGKMLSYKFASFHRFDKEDLLVYFGNFDKEQIVNMQFLFDKEGKMINFKFQPVKVEKQEENSAEATDKKEKQEDSKAKNAKGSTTKKAKK